MQTMLFTRIMACSHNEHITVFVHSNTQAQQMSEGLQASTLQVFKKSVISKVFLSSSHKS